MAARLTRDTIVTAAFDVLDEALSWARHVGQTGRVALLLEGDDGTRMDRREIGNALGVGQREQVGGH